MTPSTEPASQDDPYRPGLGRSTVIHHDDEVRSISVRLPYADTRGHTKVSKESEQLVGAELVIHGRDLGRC